MDLDKEKILKQLQQINTQEQLKKFFYTYLGKKWLLAQQFKKLSSLPLEEKKQQGKLLSDLKKTLEKAFEDKQEEITQKSLQEKMQKDTLSLHTPTFKSRLGHYSLIEKELRKIAKIFDKLGFNIEDGPWITDKSHNFYFLNIPKDHPATEMHDTFYVSVKDSNEGENMVLRTHTSSYQISLMKKYGAPLKAVIPGKVFRNEKLDASHDSAFRQLEWLMVDEDVSVGTFKYIMEEFLSAYFESQTHIRLRPSYFPFVEPWFEIDVSCPICHGKGCKLCKRTGRIELLGAWMIHPQVLENWWINPKNYSGFAFGVGINRLVAIKYSISDIRLLTNWDLRFTQSR